MSIYITEYSYIVHTTLCSLEFTNIFLKTQQMNHLLKFLGPTEPTEILESRTQPLNSISTVNRYGVFKNGGIKSQTLKLSQRNWTNH